VKAYAANPDLTILSNTEPTSTTAGIQAVKSQILGVVAANIWAKTSGLDTGGTADFITVNKQCSVIVKETSNSISVGVSDPTQGNNGTITVTLNRRTSLGTLSSDPGVTVTGTSPITLSVNVSGSKGKSFNASFRLAPSPVIKSNPEMVAINGKPLSFQVTANSNPTGFGATGLPPGLSINALSGVISGTPTQNGTFIATISATNSTGTGYANLTITVAAAAADVSFAYDASATWTCPANVTAVQVEAWGAGGAGGSGYKPASGNAWGGGGAGGAYAKRTNVTVLPGTNYTINVGAGGVSSVTNGATVPGGDSWFGNSSLTNCLAKGGAGGQSVVSSGSGIAGAGGTNLSVSLGDIVYQGGNGAAGQSSTSAGGGGGSSAGTASAGTNATSYVGASAPSGGGAGGDGKSAGNGNGLVGSQPGGGGGGARGSSTGSQTLGGTGGAGQIILTVLSVAKASQVITFGMDPATATVGDAAKTLSATSSAGLTVALTSSDTRVATITSGNTLNIVGAGTTTLTATQTGDGSYDAALPVSVILTVSAPSGTTFASWSANAAVTSDLVNRYAFGAADKNSASQKMSSAITSTQFSLTAVVRTGDSKLVITPETASDLSGPWSSSSPVITVSTAADQSGLSTGLVRKVYTFNQGSDGARFIRFKAVYTP